MTPSAERPLAPLSASALDVAGVRHGFFGAGAVVTKGADPVRDAQSRAAVAAALGLGDASRLVTLAQIHSARALSVDAPFSGSAPEADAMASASPGLALAILTADCAPILLADPEARVIGAVHAGWRGALGGVIEAGVAQMTALGAAAPRIRAAVGPCITQPAYEVGAEFVARFLEEDPRSERFFDTPSGKRAHFDLPGYVIGRLGEAGVGATECVGPCTYAGGPNWLSYRRAQHAGEAAHGRNLSAIVLESEDI